LTNASNGGSVVLMMEVVLSQYTIQPRPNGCYSLYKRGKKSLVSISTNLTNKEDAEIILSDIVNGRTTEREERERSVRENAEILRPNIKQCK
jgi:predicted RNA-binding protein with PUA domain